MSVPNRSRGAAEQRAARSFVARAIVLPAQRFIHTETIGAGVLLVAALAALVWANSPAGDGYRALWETKLTFDFGVLTLEEDLRHWVNDALMAVFFFVVGLEVKRELVHGQLNAWKRASLPLAAAVGGVAVPAGIYLALNPSGEAVRGWGVPVATDIAFALGALSLVGDRAPFETRVFLLALAAIDDIVAILIIAIFYSSDLSLIWLGAAAGFVCLLPLLNRLGVRDVKLYVFVGIALWLAVFESGIHATIAGVALGLLTPSWPYFDRRAFDAAASELLPRYREAIAAGEMERADSVLGQLEELARETESPLDRRIRKIHPWSSFFVLPLFALANAGVEVSAGMLGEAFASPVTWGVILGLVVGKPIGILLVSFLAVKTRISELPKELGWVEIAALGAVAGIGFTVSLFITDLAFADEQLAEQTKVGVLAASFAAGVAGYLLLKYVAKDREPGAQPSSR